MFATKTSLFAFCPDQPAAGEEPMRGEYSYQGTNQSRVFVETSLPPAVLKSSPGYYFSNPGWASCLCLMSPLNPARKEPSTGAENVTVLLILNILTESRRRGRGPGIHLPSDGDWRWVRGAGGG